MPESADPTEVLFTPFSINQLTVANRIVMSPMAALQPQSDGRPSRQTLAFLGARAKGGVGLIIVGGSTPTRRVHAESPIRGNVRLDHDRFVPGLQRLTDEVHQYGTAIFAELMPGFGTMARAGSGWEPIAASARNVVIPRDQLPKGILAPADRVSVMPREATVEEIHALEEETVAAALRCRRAGFDGVEVAAHMSYFLGSFLSPRKNVRTDEYGGSVENRARVLVNIVRGIREQAGDSFPIGLRICANEHVAGGQGPEEYAAIARVVEREGLDYIALVDGIYESMRRAAPETDAATVDHGEAQVFREALSCPLILGSIHDPWTAAQVIASGQADAVMFARQMLADPEYARKVRDGLMSSIVACDRHNLCMRRMAMGMPVRCSVNPRMGRESRQPGARPPLDRLVKAPVERAVLSATGSAKFMNLVGKLTKG
jgi:2,4-dienoyl-CoA reductase (NADPH2)